MNPEEDNMSTEDRVRWLRERGIQIHLPGERHDSTSAQYELRVVKIPADDRLPFEEVVLQASLGSSGDQLVELLPQEIRKTSTRISASLLDQEVLKDLSRSLKGSSIGNGDATVDRPIDIKPSTLEKQLQLGGVEAFTLCHPSPENNFTRVAAYVDEAGLLKSLPLNKRAAAIADLCEFKAVKFYGDVYIGKYVVGGDGVLGTGSGPIRNQDFLLEDLSSDAEWIKKAARVNYEHGVRTGSVTMDSESIPGTVCTETQVEAVEGRLAFSWSQTSDSVSVNLQLPAGTATSDVFVEFSPQQLRVTRRGDGRELLLLRLSRRIAPSDCTWTIIQNEMELTLEKSVEGNWTQLELE